MQTAVCLKAPHKHQIMRLTGRTALLGRFEQRAVAYSRIEFRKVALYSCKRKARPQSDYVFRVFCSLDMVTTLYFPSHAMHVHMRTISASVATAGNFALSH